VGTPIENSFQEWGTIFSINELKEAKPYLGGQSWDSYAVYSLESISPIYAYCPM